MKATTCLLICALFGLSYASQAAPPNFPDTASFNNPGPTLHAAVEASIHRARPGSDADTWELQNPTHGFSARFDGGGLALEVSTPSQQTPPRSLRWDTVAWGRGQELIQLGSARIEVNPGAPNQIDLQREGVTEWYVNRSCGLEHGYTLLERPRFGDLAEDLRLVVAVTGEVSVTLGHDRESLLLVDGEGREVLRYGKLLVWDATGRTLGARMLPRPGGLEIQVEDAGAVYPVTIDPVFTQQAYLKASNSGDDDFFGFAVAVDGDTAVVGAPFEDELAVNSGAAYVFVRDGATWSEQAILRASNAGPDDEFGSAVAVSGNTVVVGARLEDGGGAESGAAYVFVRNGTNWTEQAYLQASNAEAGDEFGKSVSVSGDTVLVGAFGEDSNATGVDGVETNNTAGGSGAAYVFFRTGTNWAQQAYLKASNTGVGDQFGFSVSIEGDTAVIGAPQENSDSDTINAGQTDETAGDAGAAYVYTRSGTIWLHRAYLKASNSDANDNFGYSVSLDGETIAVGAPGEDSDASDVDGNEDNNFFPYETSGAVYVFNGAGASWSKQAYVKASNPEELDNFGRSLSVSGNALIVGAHLEDSNAEGIDGDGNNNDSPSSGAAYVYLRDGMTWARESYIKASNTGGGDFFGHSVAASGDTFLVGAPREDSAASGVGGGQIDNSSPNAGAAYVILGVGDEFGVTKTWGAGRDLSVNEVGDLPAEEDGVNATIGAWSYGTRATAGGTALTVFMSAQHQNGAGNPDVDGWVPDAGVLVNRGTGPVTVSLGGETSTSVLPDQIILKPVAGVFPVVRWTAPANGTYNITGRWLDLDATAGTGATGYAFVNGISVMGSAGLRWPNGGGAELSPRSFRLTAGDVVDFLVGTGADPAGDLTAFNAVIRRAPDFSLSAPATITAGDPLTVTVDIAPDTVLRGVALRLNGQPFATDVTEPFQFVLPDLPVGEHMLQADGVDADKVIGASNVLTVTVDEAPAAPSFSLAEVAGDFNPPPSGPSGRVYDCLVTGLWSDSMIWKRRGDNANGIPGAGDVAFIGNSCQVTLTGDVVVGGLYCEGIVQGENGSGHELAVTHHFSTGGTIRDLDVVIPEGGTFSNLRFPSTMENVKVLCQGNIVIAKTIHGENSEVTCSGSLEVLAPPGNSGPVYLRVESIDLSGSYLMGAGTGILSEGIALNGEGVLADFLAPGFHGPGGEPLPGNDGGSLLSDAGGGIVSDQGSGLVGLSEVPLIGQDGDSLIGHDGSTLIGQDGGSLIGQDGGSLIGQDGGSLIGEDGASLLGNDGGSLGTIAAPLVFAANAINSPPAFSLGSADVAEPAGGQAFLAAMNSGCVLNGGTLRGSATFFGSVRNAGCSISLGRSNAAGQIRVVGDFVQEENGILTLEIGGTGLDPLQFDRLAVTGDATLGGELIIQTFDGFVPQTGLTVRPFTYGSFLGSFARVSSNSILTFGVDGMTAEVLLPKPSIRVTAFPNRIREGKTGAFIFRAPTGTQRPLTIGFQLSGSASAGADYVKPRERGRVSLPLNRDTISLLVRSKKDRRKEKGEALTMRILPSENYELGSPSSAKMTILNVKPR